MAEKFPNLVKEKVTQVQEAERVPIKMNPKRPTPRHIINKMAKVKDNLEGNERETVIYLQGSSHKVVK